MTTTSKELALVFIPAGDDQPKNQLFACRFIHLNPKDHVKGVALTPLNVARAIEEHCHPSAVVVSSATAETVSLLQLRFEASLGTASQGLRKLFKLAKAGELQKFSEGNRNSHHTYITFVNAVGEFRDTGRQLIEVAEKIGMPCQPIIDVVADPLFFCNYMDDAISCARGITVRFGGQPLSARSKEEPATPGEKPIIRMAFVYVPGHTRSPIPSDRTVEAVVLNPKLPGKVTAVNVADAVDFHCKPGGAKASDATKERVDDWATKFEQSTYRVAKLWRLPSARSHALTTTTAAISAPIPGAR